MVAILLKPNVNRRTGGLEGLGIILSLKKRRKKKKKDIHKTFIFLIYGCLIS